MGERWYRYVDVYDYSSDEDEPHYCVALRTFMVRRETPKGVWIAEADWMKPRFVLKSANKRYAYPTAELAMESFRIRKGRQLQHLERGLERVRAVLETLAAIGDA